ncbi:hypothetical protein Dsin_006655 [Dipteronia sinensis]|uniref:Uncharacterized protein n=1 Tax=Dipteronia sinensis TaxID=43782 RepID=A0AAE0EFS0_9ROSI|nr:hypothetical protein Dsin_006655 [Dipteronia sinensis]
MQMSSELKDLLKTPEDEWYDGKITRHDHFSDLKDIDVALDSVPEQFKVEDRRRYTESCFGHFLRMDRGMKFSGSVVHRLLLRELHHDGPQDEMIFLLGTRSVRFSKVEFCLITGMKFGVIPDTTRDITTLRAYHAPKVADRYDSLIIIYTYTDTLYLT